MVLGSEGKHKMNNGADIIGEIWKVVLTDDRRNEIIQKGYDEKKTLPFTLAAMERLGAAPNESPCYSAL
jgi:hypothetical protein